MKAQVVCITPTLSHGPSRVLTLDVDANSKISHLKQLVLGAVPSALPDRQVVFEKGNVLDDSLPVFNPLEEKCFIVLVAQSEDAHLLQTPSTLAKNNESIGSASTAAACEPGGRNTSSVFTNEDDRIYELDYPTIRNEAMGSSGLGLPAENSVTELHGDGRVAFQPDIGLVSNGLVPHGEDEANDVSERVCPPTGIGKEANEYSVNEKIPAHVPTNGLNEPVWSNTNENTENARRATRKLPENESPPCESYAGEVVEESRLLQLTASDFSELTKVINLPSEKSYRIADPCMFQTFVLDELKTLCNFCNHLFKLPAPPPPPQSSRPAWSLYAQAALFPGIHSYPIDYQVNRRNLKQTKEVLDRAQEHLAKLTDSSGQTRRRSERIKSTITDRNRSAKASQQRPAAVRTPSQSTPISSSLMQSVATAAVAATPLSASILSPSVANRRARTRRFSMASKHLSQLPHANPVTAINAQSTPVSSTLGKVIAHVALRSTANSSAPTVTPSRSRTQQLKGAPTPLRKGRDVNPIAGTIAPSSSALGNIFTSVASNISANTSMPIAANIESIKSTSMPVTTDLNSTLEKAALLTKVPPSNRLTTGEKLHLLRTSERIKHFSAKAHSEISGCWGYHIQKSHDNSVGLVFNFEISKQQWEAFENSGDSEAVSKKLLCFVQADGFSSGNMYMPRAFNFTVKFCTFEIRHRFYVVSEDLTPVMLNNRNIIAEHFERTPVALMAGTITSEFSVPKKSVRISCVVVIEEKLSSTEMLRRVYENCLKSKGLSGANAMEESRNDGDRTQANLQSFRDTLLDYLNNDDAPVISESRLNPSADDIEVGDTTVSFICPLSLTRMKNPVKGINCRHWQAFEAEAFFEFNVNNQDWRCIVCNCSLLHKDIILDLETFRLMAKYQEDDKCIVKSDGSDTAWKIPEAQINLNEAADGELHIPKKRTLDEVINLDSDDEERRQPWQPVEVPGMRIISTEAGGEVILID